MSVFVGAYEVFRYYLRSIFPTTIYQLIVMICIPGSSALSVFRLQKLHQQFDNQGVKLTKVSCRYIHLVDLGSVELSEANDSILRSLHALLIQHVG